MTLSVALCLCGIALGVYRWVEGVDREDFKSVPDGFLFHIVWIDSHAYFVREPLFSSSGVNQLWRAGPGGSAERLELAHSCTGGAYVALAQLGDSALSSIIDCGSMYEVHVLDTITRQSKQIQTFDKGYSSAIVHAMTWAEGDLLVSGDGYKCTGIGRIRQGRVLPVPAPTVEGKSFDVGKTYERSRGDCEDLPAAGFVVTTPSALAFMASADAIGVAPDNREEVSWSLYITDREWSTAHPRIHDFKIPTDSTSFRRCVLISATRDVPGIWLVEPGVQSPSLLVEGRFTEFAIEESGRRLIALEGSNNSDSLKLVTFDSSLRRKCSSVKSTSHVVSLR